MATQYRLTSVMYGDALRMLDSIGACAVMGRLGQPRIRRGRKIRADRSIVGYVLPVDGHDYGYGTPRKLIDKALRDHARTLPGVTVRERFTVRKILWENRRAIGVESCEEGEAITLRAGSPTSSSARRASRASQHAK